MFKRDIFNWIIEDEAALNKWMKSISDEEADYITSIRSGDLCFDLIERNVDGINYVLADLYVGGIDTGYGYSKDGYPYDFADSIGGMWKSDEIKRKGRLAKNFILRNITKIIMKEGGMYEKGSLINKGKEPLNVW